MCRVRRIKRPIRFLKCLWYGHRSFKCISNVNRPKNCFQCGEMGHQAKICRNELQRMICIIEDAGLYNHPMVSFKCPAYQRAQQSI